MAADSQFGLYVSSVEGRLVTRFGVSRPGVQAFIGAERTLGNPSEITWSTAAVIGITHRELALYRREYAHELATGGLVKRTAAEYEAQFAPEISTPKNAPKSAGEVK